MLETLYQSSYAGGKNESCRFEALTSEFDKTSTIYFNSNQKWMVTEDEKHITLAKNKNSCRGQESCIVTYKTIFSNQRNCISELRFIYSM